jgi:hypothetical protein
MKTHSHRAYGSAEDEEFLLLENEVVAQEVATEKVFPRLRTILLVVAMSVLLTLGVALTTRTAAPLELSISDDAVDDLMTVDCVTTDRLKEFSYVLQFLHSNVNLGTPSGAVVLSDRGQLGILKSNDPSYQYDYEALYQDLIDSYDVALTACTDIDNGVIDKSDDCPYIDYESVSTIDALAENLFFNTTLGSSVSSGISCVESCVEDRIKLYSETVGGNATYSDCSKPVTAAMVYTVPLFKSCLQQSYDCTEGGIHDCPFTSCYDCITDCLYAEYDR